MYYIKRIIFALSLTVVFTNCSNPIKERDAKLKSVIFAYLNKFPLQQISLKIDSIKLVSIDSLTLSQLNYIYFQDASEKAEQSINIVNAFSAKFGYDIAITKLSSGSEFIANRNIVHQDRPIGDSLMKMMNSAVSRADSINKLSGKQDSIKFNSFLVKTIIFAHDYKSNSPGKVDFFISDKFEVKSMHIE